MPLDLVAADPERTPFNTPFAARFDDFTRDEARMSLPTLALASDDPATMLDVVVGRCSTR